MTEVVELFGNSTASTSTDWKEVVKNQHCPYLARRCTKVRKSAPEVAIGTCSVLYGRSGRPVLICPARLLERRQIFTDCLHLLTNHEPGNELHVVPEVSLPGGSVDYFIVSVREHKAKDFVAVELQTLDTTGTVWPARQRFLQSVGATRDAESSRKTFGMNWKMTAKTTLIQLHHKIQTLEALNKHLVLVIQDLLLEYLRKEFRLAHLSHARNGDSMQIHAYELVPQKDGSHRMSLGSRLSTDVAGLAVCLGLQAEPKVELEKIIDQLESKMSAATLLRL